MDDTMAALMANWKTAHDELEEASAPIKAEIDDLLFVLNEVKRPFAKRLMEIEDEIRPLAVAHAATFKAPGVEVRYRKGARRVSYKWQIVDSVLGVLRDVLPETALTLEGARKESTGKPSVSIVRVEEKS